MSWRPWLLAAVLIGALVVNAGLLFRERIDPPAEVVDFKDEQKDPLLGTQYISGNRRSNFKAFGMSDEMVKSTMSKARAYEKDKKRLKVVIEDAPEDVTRALCPGGKLPPRYAGVGVLTEIGGTGRVEVLAPSQVRGFYQAEWFGESLADEVYAELELDAERQNDATVMGIGALLLRKDADAVDGVTPWGQGFGTRWGLDAMLSNYPEVEPRLIEYFAMLHVVAELVRDPEEGLCG